MSWANALAAYAKQLPSKIPAEVLVLSNDHFTVINDAYPKSTYHHLVLPRLPFPSLGASTDLPEAALGDLKSLLRLDKDRVLTFFEALEEVVGEVEEKMRKEHGFVWDVVYGFHAVPSMKHLHLHVLSLDLVSPALKNKKHYNSFHPTLGFFLPLETVKGWVQDQDTIKLALDSEPYELLLTRPLSSFHTQEIFPTIPKLKLHLVEQLKREEKKAKRNG